MGDSPYEKFLCLVMAICLLVITWAMLKPTIIDSQRFSNLTQSVQRVVNSFDGRVLRVEKDVADLKLKGVANDQ